MTAKTTSCESTAFRVPLLPDARRVGRWAGQVGRWAGGQVMDSLEVALDVIKVLSREQHNVLFFKI